VPWSVHWRYLASELSYRWKRTVLLVGGIALAATLVAMLDILGRGFADVATVPFRNLGADLIVQRGTVEKAVPKTMGIMLPYSAQPILPAELARLGTESGVSRAEGFVLLWNFGAGRFYSISGIPFDSNAPSLGPGRVREWLIKGRLPAPGSDEILVERHYGAFYRLDPGSTVEFGNETFTVVGVVDIKEGSQIAASNFYMDINRARSLGALPANAVNQVFLKVADMAETENVKRRIAGWMPRASVASPGTMLQLFGGVSQAIGRFGPLAVGIGALVALALSAALVLGVVSERRRDLALLSVLGWEPQQVRRQMTVEMVVQGLLAGLVAVALIMLGLKLVGHVPIVLPGRLPGENPVDFANGGFRLASSSVLLPAAATIWDWVLPPIGAAAACGAWGWIWSRAITARGLWAAIKST
jgi:putative ABC transport system permease protein